MKLRIIVEVEADILQEVIDNPEFQRDKEVMLSQKLHEKQKEVEEWFTDGEFSSIKVRIKGLFE